MSRGFETTGALLLAAGTGARFGGAKLAASLAGEPVAHHPARMLSALPFAQRIAVRTPDAPSLGGFGFGEIVIDTQHAMMSRSIASGIAQFGQGIEAVLIAVADMPLVPRAHVAALVETFGGDRIASRSGGRTMPPAIFGRAWFSQLEQLAGDRGAAVLLGDAPSVDLPAGAAIDVDTRADLARAERMLSRS